MPFDIYSMEVYQPDTFETLHFYILSIPNGACYGTPMVFNFADVESRCEEYDYSESLPDRVVYRTRLFLIRNMFENMMILAAFEDVWDLVIIGLYQDENFRWRWSDGSPITFTFFDGVVGDGSQMPTTNVQGTAGRSYAVLHTSGERKGQWQSYSMENSDEKCVICVYTPA